MRDTNELRSCRCGAEPEALRIKFVDAAFTGDVMLVTCGNCYHEVSTLVFGHYIGPLAAAWSDANMPKGVDAGISTVWGIA